MAHVMQCDICNNIYDKPGDDVMHNGSFTVLTTRHGFGDTTHLCPRCTRMIEDFINALKSGEQYCVYVGAELIQRINRLIESDFSCEGEDKQVCDYCRGAQHTDKPFTVNTQMGSRVEVVFNFCPVCGRDLRKEDKQDG